MNEPCAIELFFVNFNSIKFKRKKKKDVEGCQSRDLEGEGLDQGKQEESVGEDCFRHRDGKYKQSDLGRVWGDTVAFRNWGPSDQNAKNNMGSAGKLQGAVLSLLDPLVATPDTV